MGKKRSGILVEVYRDSGKAKDPNGKKLTDRHDTVLFVLPEGGPFEESEEHPAVEIEPRGLKCSRGPMRGTTYVNVVPSGQPHGPGRTAFGGNFIFTSDSRFPSEYPIAVHDMDPFGQ